MKKIISLVIALVFSAVAQAQAAPEVYAYDPLHTQVLFSINHMGYTNVHGRFNKLKGGFTLDEQNPETATADITIDAASVDLPDATWMEHTREKFLEPEKFPIITFKSTGVKRTGDKTATMTGNLTLHGVTKQIEFPATVALAGKDVKGDAEFTINRKDFGISYAGKEDDLIREGVVLKIHVAGKAQ